MTVAGSPRTLLNNLSCRKFRCHMRLVLGWVCCVRVRQWTRADPSTYVSKQNDFAERPAPLGQADPVDISHFPPANDNEPASVRLLVRGWMVLLNRLIARIIPFFELMDDI